MNPSVCCLFNYPPHYRKAIYKLMDQELGCDFYFGDTVPGELKALDPLQLDGYKGRVQNVIYGSRICWQKGALKLLFKPYRNYILTVDTACVSSWIFIYASALFGKRVFFWTHGAYGNESFLSRLKSRLYFLPAKSLLLYGEYAKKKLLEEGYRKEKLSVIGNSLDYEEHLSIRQKLHSNPIFIDHFGNTNPVIIFVGRLEKKKKLTMILECLSALNSVNKKVNCVFIGDGGESKALVKEAGRLNLGSQTWFYGACYDEHELGNLIFNADLCLSPGNVGLTAIHSLSFGTPVITHSDFAKQMPEFEAIEKTVTGDFFKEDDVEDMTRVVVEWFDKNPRKTESLIMNCYRVIDQKYNPRVQLKVLKTAINS